MTATVVWHLPHPSQEFDQGPQVRQLVGNRFVIAYDFERHDGSYAWENLIFVDVAAYAFTIAPHCSEEQIGAYDKLQVLDPRQWDLPIREAPAEMQHFRIYFDDIGCYDVLAISFLPPDCEHDGRSTWPGRAV